EPAPAGLGGYGQPGPELLGQETMSVSGTEALGHPGPYEPELLNLIPAVQPVATCIPVGDHECVPVFPGAKGGNRKPDHVPDGADAVKPPVPVLHHHLRTACRPSPLEAAPPGSAGLLSACGT